MYLEPNLVKCLLAIQNILNENNVFFINEAIYASYVPTNVPTYATTNIPTNVPTNAPTNEATNALTNAPTYAPTNAPNNLPANVPTNVLTNVPTYIPINTDNAQIIHSNTNRNELGHYNPEVNKSKGFRNIEDLLNNNIFYEMWKNCLVFNTRVSNAFPYRGKKDTTYIYKTYGPKDFDSFLKAYPARRAEFNPYQTDNYLELGDQAISDVIDGEKTPINDIQKCLRCYIDFEVSKNGSTLCLYHPGKSKMENKQVVFSCCNTDQMAKPCASHSFHIFNNIPVGYPGPYKDFISTQNKGLRHKIYGMDCEMIYTSHGFEVASVSVVSSNYNVLIKTYVRPEGEVYDLVTDISGIKQEDIARANSLSDVRKFLIKNISSNDILVGHGLENDLICLKMVHRNIIDTSLLPWKGCDVDHKYFKRPSLKNLAKEYLNKEFHLDGESHNSTEDAIMALQLAAKFHYST